ncbi:hypothetical protein [Saccharolobus caldissimus]|uniref:Uncharacterized protein n=1 Tax=Saccharolobus caldissimus TaxID=1702097 RepID=A0AAQ4CRY6_9CREN|nr:hypothetical protein [Saccharolobus caldissimus]BDB98567.1 hypothetical protein SACC_15840 [Saccharolobus caldissimus]
MSEIAIPPIFIPFIRDSAITFWNYVVAYCDDLQIEDYRIDKGLERIRIRGDICNCLTRNENIRPYWTKKSGETYNCDNKTLKEFNYGEIRIGESDKGRQLILRLGSEGMSLFAMNIMKEITNIIRSKQLYSFARGYPILNERSFTLSRKLDPLDGRFYLDIRLNHNLIIRGGYNIGKVLRDVFLFTSEIWLQDKSVIIEFFENEFKQFKYIISNVMKTFKGEMKENPIIQDILYERLLLETIKNSLSSSIVYAYNWPSLRLYVSTKTSLISIEFPSSVFDIAKAAIIESSRTLGYSPIQLIRIVTKALDEGIKIKQNDRERKIILPEMYSLANSVLQGNPDIDLFYKLMRTMESERK